MATTDTLPEGKKTGYFPRNDTPLIPELITSERPENLDGYFDFVENILDKSFRDNALVHVALRTTKITSLEFKQSDKDDTGDRPSTSSSSTAATASNGKKKQQQQPAPAVVVPNHFIFSPRLIVRRDGTTFGKFKVGTRVAVDDIVDCYQRVKIDTNGAVTMKATAGNLMSSGVSLDGLIQVNLIDDAIRDEISLKASVVRNDAVCFSMLGSRDGAGTTALKADGDVRLFNVHLGCGVEHHWGGFSPVAPLSLPNDGVHTMVAQNGEVDAFDDQQQHAQLSRLGSFGGISNGGMGGAAIGNASMGAGGGLAAIPPSSTLYVGAGCFGKGWHMAGKLFRDDGEWTEAQIVLYQNIHKLASIAAVYKVNTQEGLAETTIGVSRRFTLWGHKLVTAAKVSTNGLISVLTEINLDAFTRIGLVTKFTPSVSQRPTFGIIASLQSD